MQYSVFLISQDETPGSLPQFTPVGSVTTEGEDDVLATQLKAELFATMSSVVTPVDLVALGAPRTYRPNSQPGRPAKMLVVLQMTEDASNLYPVQVNGLYPSSELSSLLKYDYNRAAQALSKAKLERTNALKLEMDVEERAKLTMYPPSATLRGVTFYSEEDTAGLEHVE